MREKDRLPNRAEARFSGTVNFEQKLDCETIGVSRSTSGSEEMSPILHLRIKTLVLVVLMVAASSVGDIFLKQGMDRIPVQLDPASLGNAFAQTVARGQIWMGIACLLIGFVLYLMLLLVVLVLGESVTLGRWAGVALICLGVGLVGRTEPRTTGAD